jgi:hypothetical protein
MHLGIARSHSIGLLLAAALVGHASAQDGNNCEAIRAQIESKIAASGVAGFSVTVVDANAAVDGQVVGSCALGTRKIVYARPGPAGVGHAAPPAPSRGSAIVTECKDGTSSVGGDCRK